MKGMFIYFIKLKQKVIITNFTFLSRRNVGLKLEYQLGKTTLPLNLIFRKT